MGMHHTDGEELCWGYLLLCKGEDEDSEGLYVFDDWIHASTWMRQGYIQGKGYRVHACLYKRRKCCGEAYAFKVGAKMLC